MVTSAEVMNPLHQAPRLYFRADLVLDSGLHLGTGAYDDARGLAGCYRDGQGKIIIPGSSLAGVFLDTVLASTVTFTAADLKHLTGKHLPQNKKAQEDLIASRLIFHNSRPLAPDTAQAASDRRDGVRIRRDTRTAAHGAKYAHEVIEPGIRFRLYLELEFWPDDLPARRRELAALVLTVLAERWADPNCPNFLGAASARGSGWFHLENLKAAAVSGPQGLRSFLDEPETTKWVDDHAHDVSWADVAAWAGNLDIAWPTYQGWEVRIHIIEDADGYGVWPLLVRAAPGQSLVSDTDLEFVRTRIWSAPDAQGGQTPQDTFYIPGSSLRGAGRALLTGLVRGGQWQGNLTLPGLDELFGDDTCTAASRLKFRDAYYISTVPAQQIVHRLAKDEFTGGALDTAKFDEQPLFAGEFAGRIILENPKPEELAILDTLFAWGDAGWAPLGAYHTPVRWSRAATEVPHD